MENRLPGFLCGMYMPGYWCLSIFALHNKFPVLPLYYTLLFYICQSLERVRGLPRGFGLKPRRVSNFSREAVGRWCPLCCACGRGHQLSTVLCGI